jgi:predicted MFS family arabinose efflux permease
MRLEWGKLVGDADRTSAYSLVYLTQQLAILAGPLILAGTVAAASASAALIVVAAVAAAGSLGFAATVAPDGEGAAAPGERGRSVLRIPAMRLLMATILMLGAAIGALEVAAPTLATDHRAPAAAGLLIACLSVGGVLGATIYGSGRWRAAPGRRLLVLVVLVTVALAPMIVVDDLVAVGALLLLAGIALNPALTTFSLIVDQHVDARAAGEAFGWISTAISSGQGGASALAAAVAQHQRDPRPAFVIATLAGAAATVLCLAARRVFRARGPLVSGGSRRGRGSGSSA